MGQLNRRFSDYVKAPKQLGSGVKCIRKKAFVVESSTCLGKT